MESQDKNKYPVCKSFELHPQRKLCKECRHPQKDHQLDDNVRQHIQEEVESLAEDSGAAELRSDNTYAWMPPGCPQERLEEFFENFPDEKIPKNQTEGATFRLQQLLKQVPPTDISKTHCRFVEHEYEGDLEAHIQHIRKKALHFGSVKEWKEGMPMQCPTCLKLQEEDDLVVVPTEVTSTAFHPDCFVCCFCKEPLEDLIHCTEVSGKIYCVRHYSETLKKRCHVCDELIFASRFAQAGEAFYHKNHLLCFHCDQLLEDEKGFDKDGELYCGECYEKKFGQKCHKCGEKIQLNSRHVTFEDKFWHYACFTCEKCGKVITKFEQHEGKFYCTECYSKNYAPRCNECKEVFEGTTKVVKYQNEIYHVKCFKCGDCGEVIGTGTFSPHGPHIYCRACHAKNFGVRCAHCKEAIADDKGIMFDKKPFHKECFTCCHCKKGIAEESFKQIEGELYCLACYGEVFCTKCHVCEKPVYLGENEYLYSYGDYKWHSACFMCSNCKQSLADTPFMIQGKSLLCRNCTSKEDIVSATKGRREVEGKASGETKTRHAEHKDQREADAATGKSGAGGSKNRQKSKSKRNLK